MESKVRVIVRVRPFLPEEDPSTRYITTKGGIIELDSQVQKIRYQCDASYAQDSTQEQIFSEVQSLIPDVFQGINATIFAYGMTGAGKTHTMQGSTEAPGIIPRVANRIVELAETTQKPTEILVSYLEIYNERVYDLLEPKGDEQDLPIRQANGEIMIPGLSVKKITTFSAFEQLYKKACKNRTVASNGINNLSSRSHAILSLNVRLTDDVKITTGKINLIDLAGSEDNRYTDNRGQRLTESSNINTSLFVLGKVVNALNEGIRVPYRDSKLTRLLQDSLGGKSNAILIANIAPSQQFLIETQRTLHFASKSRKIVNRVVAHTELIPKPAENDADERRRKLEEWKKSKGKTIPSKNKSVSATNLDKENLRDPSVVPTSTSTAAKVPQDDSARIAELLSQLDKMMGGKLGNGSAIDLESLEGRLKRLEQLEQSKAKKDKLKKESKDSKDSTKKKLETSSSSDSDNSDSGNSDSESDESDSSSGELWLPGDKFASAESKSQSQPVLPKPVLPNEREQDFDDSGSLPLSLLTPSTKDRTAKSFVLAGKKQEQRGQLQNALALYENAIRLLPNGNAVLSKKIRVLKEQLGKPRRDSEEDKSSSESVQDSAEKPASCNSSVTQREAEVLNLLNTGSVKDLTELHMIADKRAKLIIVNRPFSAIDDLKKVHGLGAGFAKKFYTLNVAKMV